MTNSDMTEIASWFGPDENNGDWPYPTKYKKSLVGGELADRVRHAFGITGGAPVLITEEIVSGGYSEYTQEDYYNFTIECAGQSQDFEGDLSWNGLNKLLAWLDNAESNKEN